MDQEDLRFVGVDLGKTGVICILRSIDDYEFIPMPLKKTPSGKMEYCDIQITQIFKDFIPIAHCVFENISLPPEFANTHAIKSLAEAEGFFKGLCRGLKIPFTCCGARKWNNAMFDNIKDGSTKKRSLKASKAHNPEVDLKRTERCRVDDHNRSDAYLMALYAKQEHERANSYMSLWKRTT